MSGADCSGKGLLPQALSGYLPCSGSPVLPSQMTPGPPWPAMLYSHPFILWVPPPFALPSSVLWALDSEQIFDIHYESLEWRMKMVSSH